MATIQIELPAKTFTKLEHIAQQEQKTISDLIQQLLDEHLLASQTPPAVENKPFAHQLNTFIEQYHPALKALAK